MPIDPRYQELWSRIVAHDFDAQPARLKFTDRLARENGWTIDRTYRVVDEYRRFIFLAITAGHPVTPSEDVDQVWHLHLAYTRDYWEKFCGEVLCQPLHHGPGPGSTRKADRCNQQYRQTLASYEAAFDSQPPDDIWPEYHVRFGRDLAWKRVNFAQYWVIPKPSWSPLRLGIVVNIFLVVSVLILAINTKWDEFVQLLILANGLLFGLVVRIVSIPIGDPRVTISDIDLLELALLSNHPYNRFAAAALITVKAEPIRLNNGNLTGLVSIPSEPPPGMSPLATALYQRLSVIGNCTPKQAISVAVQLAREVGEARLASLGLLISPWWKSLKPWKLLIPAFITFSLIFLQFTQGVFIWRNNFTYWYCLFAWLILLRAVARNPRHTKRGNEVWRDAQLFYRESKQYMTSSEPDSTERRFALDVALHGTGILMNTTYHWLWLAVGFRYAFADAPRHSNSGRHTVDPGEGNNGMDGDGGDSHGDGH